MSTIKKSPRSKLLMFLGLPFLLSGLGALVMSPLDTLRLHVVSAGWERVPVRLEHVGVTSSRGNKGSTTYKVEALYQYEFGGRTYQGTRVGYDTGTDSFRDDHDEWADRLRAFKNRGEPVLAWVNPADPQQAFLVRELRWKKLLFMTVFSILFGGVGGVLTVLGAWPVAKRSPFEQQGPIYSAERYSYWLWVGMGLVFVLATVPAWFEIPKQVRAGNPAILLVLLFPLAGAWMLRQGVRSYRNWQYYGPLPLEMDPQPGQVGGDVGGRIRLRVPYQDGNPYRVTLQCLQSKKTSRSQDNDRSESLLWQEEQVPSLHVTSDGIELRFLFQPPAHLPQTEFVRNSHHFWRLLLSGPEQPARLERTYELPVQHGEKRSRVSIPATHREQRARETRVSALELASEQILVTQQDGGVQIHSPLGAHLGMKLVFLLFSVMFAGMAMFLTHQAQKEGGMLWLMAVVFSLFGYPMLVGGIFTVGRALKVVVRQGELRSVRYWFGIPLWRRQMTLARADQFRIESGVKTSDGRRYKEYFHLIVMDGSRKLRVAEDIAGREAAEAMRDGLVNMLGLKG